MQLLPAAGRVAGLLPQPRVARPPHRRCHVSHTACPTLRDMWRHGGHEPHAFPLPNEVRGKLQQRDGAQERTARQEGQVRRRAPSGAAPTRPSQSPSSTLLGPARTAWLETNILESSAQCWRFLLFFCALKKGCTECDLTVGRLLQHSVVMPHRSVFYFCPRCLCHGCTSSFVVPVFSATALYGHAKQQQQLRRAIQHLLTFSAL